MFISECRLKADYKPKPLVSGTHVILIVLGFFAANKNYHQQ